MMFFSFDFTLPTLGTNKRYAVNDNKNNNIYFQCFLPQCFFHALPSPPSSLPILIPPCHSLSPSLDGNTPEYPSMHEQRELKNRPSPRDKRSKNNNGMVDWATERVWEEELGEQRPTLSDFLPNSFPFLPARGTIIHTTFLRARYKTGRCEYGKYFEGVFLTR